MLRAFHPFAVSADADKIVLSGEESFHLSKVLRANKGESVEAFDGHGNVWSGKILGGNVKALEISVESHSTIPVPACRISLAQAMPKGSHMDDIVRQATEIGVAKIYPLQSARCEVHIDASRAEKKLERWNAIAVESCKQCGNAFLPEILPVTQFSTFYEGSSDNRSTLCLVASLEPDARSCHSLAETLKNAPAPTEILFLVGPEGDFSPEEYFSARKAGFIPTRLAGNVLRSVTAAIYALAVADQLRQTILPASF